MSRCQGMLAAADTIEAVARQVVKHQVPALVVDPVRTRPASPGKPPSPFVVSAPC